MKSLKIALALLVALVLAVPAGAQTEEPRGTITATDKGPTDAEIDRRIEAILREIDGLEDIFATVRSGVVTLHGQVAEAALAAKAEQLASRVEGVVEVRNGIGEITSVSKRIAPAWERLKNRTLQFVNYLPLTGLAALIFAAIALAGNWLAGLSWPLSRIAPNAFIAHLLRQVIRLVFVGIGLVVALDFLGATAVLGTVLGAAGIVGLAVGFAVRDTVENYIASILLSVRQPFRPNDWVEIGGEEGSVIMLTSRATILMDAGGNHIRIPNSTVFKGVVRNYTRNPERRFDFALGVDPAADLRAALDLGIATMRAFPFTLEVPGPDAWIDKVGDSSVVIRFAGWVNQNETSFLQAKSEAIRLVKSALEGAGHALPEPGYRVTLTEPVAKPKPKSAPRGKTGRAAGQGPGDTSADDTIARKVDEERARVEGGDLLDNSAPQEIG